MLFFKFKLIHVFKQSRNGKLEKFFIGHLIFLRISELSGAVRTLSTGHEIRSNNPYEKYQFISRAAFVLLGRIYIILSLSCQNFHKYFNVNTNIITILTKLLKNCIFYSCETYTMSCFLRVLIISL